MLFWAYNQLRLPQEEIVSGGFHMDDELRGILIEKVRQVCSELAKKGAFLIEDVAIQAIAELSDEDGRHWKQIRDDFAHAGVTRYVNKVIAQAQTADPDQQILPGMESVPIPGLEAMPLLVTAEGAAILSRQITYERYQAEMNRLERQIKSYKYKRRKPEKLEQQEQQLLEMKQFDPRFAKYSEADPELQLDDAKKMELKESTRKKR